MLGPCAKVVDRVYSPHIGGDIAVWGCCLCGKNGLDGHWRRTDGQPTTRIVGEIRRPDESRHGFARAFAGDFGPEIQQLRGTFIAKYPGGASLNWSVNNVLKGKEDGPVSPKRVEVKDVARATQHVKDLARFYRADAVGVCELPPFAVYTHSADTGEPIDLAHKYAIAIAVDQDYRTMRGSTGFDMISGAQSFIAYSHMGFIAIQIAQYIRSLGYPARAHFPRVYQVAIPPILLFAGLGEISRAGIVLNPELGMRFKAAAVTTDYPLIPDKPIDFGLQSFCEKCKKCAKYCPSQAITSGGKGIYNGYETWVTDFASCTKFRISNKAGSSCGRCIKVCPWNRRDSWYHRLGMRSSASSGLAQRMLIEVDAVLRSNLRAEPEDRWWRIEDFAEVPDGGFLLDEKSMIKAP